MSESTDPRTPSRGPFPIALALLWRHKVRLILLFLLVAFGAGTVIDAAERDWVIGPTVAAAVIINAVAGALIVAATPPAAVPGPGRVGPPGPARPGTTLARTPSALGRLSGWVALWCGVGTLTAFAGPALVAASGAGVLPLSAVAVAAVLGVALVAYLAVAFGPVLGFALALGETGRVTLRGLHRRLGSTALLLLAPVLVAAGVGVAAVLVPLVTIQSQGILTLALLLPAVVLANAWLPLAGPLTYVAWRRLESEHRACRPPGDRRRGHG